LFLISGYFSPGSLDYKRARRFRQGPADPPRHPALMGLSLEHLLKFGLAAVMTVPLCFAAAYLVLKILFASMVL